MYIVKVSPFFTDQQANLENIPPAENLAKVLQNSPAFSKPALVLSSVTSQGMTKSKLAQDGEEGINFPCFFTREMKKHQSGYFGAIFLYCCVAKSHVASFLHSSVCVCLWADLCCCSQAKTVKRMKQKYQRPMWFLRILLDPWQAGGLLLLLRPLKGEILVFSLCEDW